MTPHERKDARVYSVRACANFAPSAHGRARSNRRSGATQRCRQCGAFRREHWLRALLDATAAHDARDAYDQEAQS